jgi:uncharacterized protein YbjT (DUF2867 family)
MMRFVVAGASGTVGRHVVSSAESRGHTVVALSRSSGHDILSGEGLAVALRGADAVIDVTSSLTTSARKARRFFTTITRNLQDAELESGVDHHVGLSIVGIGAINAGYYAGKLAQEHAIESGRVPWSLVCATQFHEFAGQIVGQGSVGPLVAVPKMLLRPIAASEVGQRLVDIAEGHPAGRLRDLAGPRDEVLVDMVRRMFHFDGVKRHTFQVALPGKYWRGAASGVLRGAEDATRAGVTFDEWLQGPDHPAPLKR